MDHGAAEAATASSSKVPSKEVRPLGAVIQVGYVPHRVERERIGCPESRGDRCRLLMRN